MPAIAYPEQQNKVWPPSQLDWGTLAAEPLLKTGDIYFNILSNTYRKCEDPTFPATWSDIAIIPGAQFQLTGAVNEAESVIGVERVIGGFLFNGGASYTNIAYRVVGRFDPGTAGNVRVRLYDMGTPGIPIVPVLRSTLSIPFASAGDIVVADTILTPAVTPGVNTDEIVQGQRMYELRIYLDGVGVGDAALIHWAGIEVN